MTSIIPSPGALLTAMSGSAATAGTQTMPYGMTMWFQVEVRDDPTLRTLGRWSGCTNLGVKLKTEAVPDGMGHDRPQFAPTSVEYPDITLERAVSKDDTARVRAWLETVVGKWVVADEGATPGGSARGYEGASVIIRLFSALGPSDRGNEITSWVLQDAYPVAWSGPSLNSLSGGGIATEKLTLAHSGFLATAGTRPSAGRSAGQAPVPGLLQLSYGAEKLELQYQPTEVTMNKAIVNHNPTKNVIIDGSQVTDPGKIGFKFTVRLEGADAVRRARTTLFHWLEPEEAAPAAAPAATGGWSSAKPSQAAGPKTGAAGPRGSAGPKIGAHRAVKQTTSKELTIRIGSGPGAIGYTVTLKKVDITFKRFTTRGDPCRATFQLDFEAVDRPTPGTNPTSGGPPGTTVHTVVRDDVLARIATTAYGSPARWREIAEENGVDDPLRLRAGRALLLPESRTR